MSHSLLNHQALPIWQFSRKDKLLLREKKTTESNRQRLVRCSYPVEGGGTTWPGPPFLSCQTNPTRQLVPGTLVPGTANTQICSSWKKRVVQEHFDSQIGGCASSAASQFWSLVWIYKRIYMYEESRLASEGETSRYWPESTCRKVKTHVKPIGIFCFVLSFERYLYSDRVSWLLSWSPLTTIVVNKAHWTMGHNWQDHIHCGDE